MVKQHGGEKPDENFEKLLVGIEPHGTVCYPCYKEWKKNKYRILGHTKLDEENGEEQYKDHITHISLER
jgi:hypothetical protein